VGGEACEGEGGVAVKSAGEWVNIYCGAFHVSVVQRIQSDAREGMVPAEDKEAYGWGHLDGYNKALREVETVLSMYAERSKVSHILAADSIRALREKGGEGAQR
jgi:hypothetical protein